MSAPWKKPAPKAAAPTKLAPKYLAHAKAAAKRAGRRYPNLIDNMAAARRQREDATRLARGEGAPDSGRP